MQRLPGRVLLLALNWVFCVGLAGCTAASSAPDDKPPPPPEVSVSQPLKRSVTDYFDFTGRTAAVESVQVQARVWGHLKEIRFPDGADVKTGDVLFVIDREPYEAALARAEADVAQSQARFQRLQADYKRAQDLLANRVLTPEEYGKISGEFSEAQAALQSATAAKAVAQLNLDFTRITAPIDGHMGRAMVTRGNLVQSGEMGGTVLTTIVSVSPIYAYFDVDDLTFQKLLKVVRRAKPSPPGEQPVVHLGMLQDESFPHVGQIDFVDNEANPGTGTIKMRAVFDNEDRALTPGLFARIRVPSDEPHDAILITDRAIDTDQGQKIVYVVNDDNFVSRRQVKLMGLHEGLREVTGLSVDERIVVDGIQRVRTGSPVMPQTVAMPVSGVDAPTASTANTTAAEAEPASATEETPEAPKQEHRP